MTRWRGPRSEQDAGAAQARRGAAAIPAKPLRMRVLAALTTLLGLTAAAGGCRPQPEARVTPPAAQQPIVFEEVTAQAGLDFTHNNGAFGKKWMPETMGSGCALVDVDRDGLLDIFLVDSGAWRGHPGRQAQSRLFLNRGHFRFQDATERYRIPGGFYGMGVTAGDFDNDGWTDLFLTGLGDSRLLRNENGRHFRDVTANSTIKTPGWPTSAAWVDYDRDGRLDLFVCRYVKWSPATDVWVSLDGVNKTYARPDSYSGEPCMLFHNEGHGLFKDVSAAAGVNLPRSKALGVALCDVLDRDGWPDLVVSNDTAPNFLFHNQIGAGFRERAAQTGIAVAEAGEAKAGMGIDAGDYENSGQDSVLITNFSGEQLSLYRRDASGLFQDVAAAAGIGTPSQSYLGFGAFFLDADLDGVLDIFVANGHIQDDVQRRSAGVAHAQPALLFRGGAQGRFTDVSAAAGALTTPRVARGAAYGDLDGDGDLDLLLSTNGGRAVLLRQAGAPANRWLRLQLEGRIGNRSAIGATITVRTSGATQTRMVRSGSSYLSHSDLAVTVGLGEAEKAEVEVRWPGGAVESFGSLLANRVHQLREGRSPGD